MTASESRLPESYLPLTPAMFHVLLVLAEGDHHGYSILKQVLNRSEGSVRLSTGTLYGIIKRLLAEGMIEQPRNRRPSARDDARRRYYRLTALGRQVAEAEARRLEEIVRLARKGALLGDSRLAFEEGD